MSKKRNRTRPRYEDYGVSRAQLEKDWDQLVQWRFIGAPEDEAELIEEACKLMHFSLTPKDGWQHLSRELRIVHFQLPERKTEDSLSCIQMAKKWDGFADQIWSMSKEIAEISHSADDRVGNTALPLIDSHTQCSFWWACEEQLALERLGYWLVILCHNVPDQKLPNDFGK